MTRKRPFFEHAIERPHRFDMEVVYSIINSHDFDISHIADSQMTMTEPGFTLVRSEIAMLPGIKSSSLLPLLCTVCPPRFHPTHNKQDDTISKFRLLPTHSLTNIHPDRHAGAVNGHHSSAA